MDIIIDNPNKSWNWCKISNNQSITYDIIEQYPNKFWDWRYISRNPNITIDIIKDNLDKPCDYYWISINSMKKGKELWIKQNIKNLKNRRKVIYKILCNKLDSDICELIINNII